MSNRNYLQPNINPTVNPVFKGIVTVDNIIILSDSNQLGTKSVSLFISSISSPGNIIAQSCDFTGEIVSISAVTNRVTDSGDATFICSVVSGGMETLITNGTVLVELGQDLYVPSINVVSHEINSGDVLKIETGGDNIAAGQAYVTFKIRVS